MSTNVSRNKVMPKFVILIISIISNVNQYDSYLIKDDNSRPMNHVMESVLEKYLSSLKKLSADLPNHNLELQIEMIEPAPHPPVVPLRRIFRTYKQPKIRRSGDERNVISHESKETKTETSTVQTTTVYASSITLTTVMPLSLSRNTPSGPQERPIYMEDLQRALKEFENKFSSIQISTGCNGNHPVQTVPFPAYTTLPSSTYIINRNIENIVELLRRGVHVETHVDQPSDENLDWLQIKIPKNI